MSGDPSGSGLTIGPNAWLKRKLHLRPQHRGVHLVTEEILAGLPELAQFQVRLFNFGEWEGGETTYNLLFSYDLTLPSQWIGCHWRCYRQGLYWHISKSWSEFSWW